MKFYLEVLKFNFSVNLAYPTEIIASILRKVTYLGFLVVFWNIILAESSDTDARGLVSYFLIANGIAVIVMSNETNFGRLIRHKVKSGAITADLVKPINPILFLYFSTIGINFINVVYGLTIILLGLAINPPTSPLSIFLFILFSINALLIGFALNLLEGTLSFIFTEINGIKNAIRHISRVFSGMLIPLTFFPEVIRSITELTPFPYMVFGPTHALTYTEINSEVIQSYGISLLWAIGGVSLILWFWQKTTRKYEAIGL